MAVGIRLDHGHEARCAGNQAAQNPEIMAQDAAIDFDPATTVY
jgi:hypothetical protein